MRLQSHLSPKSSLLWSLLYFYGIVLKWLISLGVIYKCFKPGNFSLNDWTDLCLALSRLGFLLFQRICGPPPSLGSPDFAPVQASLVLRQVFSRFHSACHWLFIFEKGKTNEAWKKKKVLIGFFPPFSFPLSSGAREYPTDLSTVIHPSLGLVFLLENRKCYTESFLPQELIGNQPINGGKLLRDYFVCSKPSIHISCRVSSWLAWREAYMEARVGTFVPLNPP